ncbi:hypothetical protein PsYK624_070630 [Phanerochaete sordida]|uniref:C2H2-type domain-containing protein n=1 Tax=Phanerochaete sordida TaxID=48140 RepID=A0A9P3GA89_9APHY|nr:hypothetical protein PsYK624_070630 [Phanerochaete sordida]
MLEYPPSYHLSLDALSLSLPPYHDAKDHLPHPPHLPPVSPPSEPAVSDSADSPPSALSSYYSPYPPSHDHRRSGSFDSLSPPTSAPGQDDLHHPRVPVEDARFAFSPPPHAPHFYAADRRQSEPAARYRQPYGPSSSSSAVPAHLSSSLPSAHAFPHDQQQAVHAQYSPRPASSYAYPPEHAAWDAPQQHHPDDHGPFTTAPVDPAAHGLAITATSAALASTSGLPLAPGLAAKVHEQQPYFDDGAWLEQTGAARPNTAGSASGSFAGHGYEHTPEPPALGRPQEGGLGAQQQQGQDARQQGEGNAVKKRPRRRYDEIERLYRCSWPNCTKAYGTLNHLNAHVTMQKHGVKRSPGEFKELRKQWRAAKKEADEHSRDRARLEQIEREREDAERRISLEYGLGQGGMPMSSLPGVMAGSSQQMPSGLPMAAHPMRSELVPVGIPVNAGMSATSMNSNMQGGALPVSLSGSMAGPVLSPGSLAPNFPASAMGIPGNHGLAGPGQSLGQVTNSTTAYPQPPPFNRSRTTGSFEYNLHHQSHPQTLHPHAQMEAQRHRGSFDAQTYGRQHEDARYDYDHRRASFDHGPARAYDRSSFDQGHRVSGYDPQYEMAVNAGALRRRGSQPYPSPHSMTHSPHAMAHAHHAQQAMTQSPRSIYSTQDAGAGLQYPEEEYEEYQDCQQQQPQPQAQHAPVPPSPVEERYANEGEYYLDRPAYQQRSWELPPLAQPHPQHSQAHLVGPGYAQTEDTPPNTDNGVVEAEVGGEGEPLLTSQGHVSLGSNRLPPNSTLLTPLPGFRGYEQPQDERWEGDKERDGRRRVI